MRRWCRKGSRSTQPKSSCRVTPTSRRSSGRLELGQILFGSVAKNKHSEGRRKKGTPWIEGQGYIHTNGHMDIELNDVGRKQAAAVAHRLSKGPKISVVYSSDLKRALDTAETIASSCGGLQVIKDLDLRERHLGDLQGLVYHEASKICPKAYGALSSQKTNQEIPGGGESLDQLYDRCTSALERIGSKHIGERVVVVTHGGVIKSLFERASPSGQAGWVLNSSVSIFHLSEGDIWTIKSWGDVSHLNQTEYLTSAFGGDGTSG